MATINKQQQSESISRRLTLFLGAFLCFFQIFVSFPVSVWKTNKFNFEAPLTYSLSVIAITIGVILIFTCLIALLAPKRFCAPLILIFTVFAAVIYIQQNLLSWNYGILDGQDLAFSQNLGRGFIDIALWISAFGLLVFTRPFLRRQTGNILITVGAITAIMTVKNVVAYGPIKTPYAIDERAKFDFSTSENIIVFLFDAYQMDLLLELIQTDPSLAEPLEGFTAYDNGVAVFAKTYPTIPLFLTGKRYQKKEPLLDFFDTAYENSLMEKMQKEGWDVGLYPNLAHFPSLINSIKLSPDIMDNAIGGISSTAKVDTYLRSLDLSFFRAVPHLLKPLVFNKGQFIANRPSIESAYLLAIGESDVPQPFKYKGKNRHGAVDFKNHLEEHGTAKIVSPAFRFYHFMIPHAPNWLDEDLKFVEHNSSFEAFRAYSMAGLKLMGEYLTTLKSIDVYDNSTIIIVSDHGMGTPNRSQYNPQTKQYEMIDKYGLQRSAAKSILLIKNPGDTGPIKVSSKAVSGIDIAPTIAAAANIDIGRNEGLDINTLPEEFGRARLFNYYEFSTWDSKYLDDFEAFEVTGHVREEAAWKRLGKIKAHINLKSSHSYEIGELMSFGADVKTDTDHLNSFITSKDFIISPNYINATKGEISLSVKLKKPPKADDTLHLQFEIYSGATIERKIVINDHARTVLLKPKRRQLNNGFIIPPYIHKGQSNFDLSFAAINAELAKPLHLSSVKLSFYNPDIIEGKELPKPF